MTAGIYRINGPDNCIYFGSAVDIESRWSKHIYDLKSNKHHSRYMQRHYNKHGLGVFTFEVVEVVHDTSILIAAEQDYLDWLFRYIDRKHIYNTRRIADSNAGIKRSAEYVKNMSVRMKNKFRDGGSVVPIGYKHTDEAKQKMSNAKKGKPLPRVVIEASIQSRVNTGTFISPEGEVVTITNFSAFAKEHNLNGAHLAAVLKGERKQHKGWRLYNG